MRCRVAGSGMCGTLQYGHKMRTKRCAATSAKELANRKGSMPISIRRGTAPRASFVCRVESTK